MLMSERFRGFLPVVIDIETAGFDPQQNAILELAAVLLEFNEDRLATSQTLAYHVLPFEGAVLDPKAIAFTGIDPYHPFRFAKTEEKMLLELFKALRKALKKHNCQKVIMVAHNASFDLSFLNAAINRQGIKKNPFHAFSTIDTVSLSAVFLGQTVLARACEAAGLAFDHQQAHSAIYDAEMTAALFCYMVNKWQEKTATP